MTPKLPAVIFDLDGTLLDPNGGITGGIARAIGQAGLPVPDPATLERMVGPKLSDALSRLGGVPEARVDAVIADYRSYYAAEGMALARVYPGVVELLQELRRAGHPLAVATQKPSGIARTLLALKGLTEFFDVIEGSPDDESASAAPPGKADIIARALQRLGQDQFSAVMVGDRYQDVEGARANELPCIGVRWGFAEEQELENAGARVVVDSAQELEVLIRALAAEHKGPQHVNTEDAVHGRI